jgi:hypothetical protein
MHLCPDNSPSDRWECAIIDITELIEASHLLERSVASLSIYFVEPCTEKTFSNRESDPTNYLIRHSDHRAITIHPVALTSYSSNPRDSTTSAYVRRT